MNEEHLDALPIGAMVQEYKILRILGAGGFGITYLGIDTHTEMKVAIKEYFPSFSAVRRESTVLPKSTSDKDEYDWGLRSFLDEAKTVASGFPNHPNIVQVLRYIPANNTAYIIMRYEDGEPLDKILRTETLTEEELLHNILLPLLDGLGKVHAAGFLHRDIKPGNIYMRRLDESPVLLDFGAARNAAAYGAAGREMTHIETEGYAPIEQSVSEEDNVAGWHQGAWSDIYALGVVAYRIIANELPPKSKVRSLTLLTKQKDPLKPAVEVGKGRFSETVLKAIDHALAFAPEDRPQSCEAWKRELTAQTAAESVKKAEKLTGQPSHHQKEKVKPSEESTGTNSGKHKEPSEAETLPKKKGNTLKFFVGIAVLIVGVVIAQQMTQQPNEIQQTEMTEKNIIREEEVAKDIKGFSLSNDVLSIVVNNKGWLTEASFFDSKGGSKSNIVAINALQTIGKHKVQINSGVIGFQNTGFTQVSNSTKNGVSTLVLQARLVKRGGWTRTFSLTAGSFIVSVEDRVQGKDSDSNAMFYQVVEWNPAKDSGWFSGHIGLIGMFDGELKEIGFSEMDTSREKTMRMSSLGGWTGIIHDDFIIALFSNQNLYFKYYYKYNFVDNSESYQSGILLDNELVDEGSKVFKVSIYIGPKSTSFIK